MSGGLRALPASDLAHSLEEFLLPRLAAALSGRTPGHCMRVSDLGPELMVALARGLRSQAPAANVHVLTDKAERADDDLYISSTKLVELRNPLADGSLRPPLCVFLPANLRTSAEDSFGSATFEEFVVGDAYATLRGQLLQRVPATLQGYVRDCLQLLEERSWRWAGSAAQVRYLLCAQANGNDGEAFGGALYELGLVPDFRLFDDPPAAYGRVRRNHECVAKPHGRRHLGARARAESRPDESWTATAAGGVSREDRSRGSCGLDPRRRPRQEELGPLVRQVGIRFRNGARQAHVRAGGNRSARRIG